MARSIKSERTMHKAKHTRAVSPTLTPTTPRGPLGLLFPRTAVRAAQEEMDDNAVADASRTLQNIVHCNNLKKPFLLERWRLLTDAMCAAKSYSISEQALYRYCQRMPLRALLPGHAHGAQNGPALRHSITVQGACASYPRQTFTQQLTSPFSRQDDADNNANSSSLPVDADAWGSLAGALNQS